MLLFYLHGGLRVHGQRLDTTSHSMDLDRTLHAVCEHLVDATPDEKAPSTIKDNTSRHAQLYQRASKRSSSDIHAFEFHRAVLPIVEEHRTLSCRPVTEWGDVIGANQQKDALAQLCYRFWLIAERHAPGQVAVPSVKPQSSPNGIPWDAQTGSVGGDPVVAPGLLPRMDTVTYECQLNHDYQSHHTIAPPVDFVHRLPAVSPQPHLDSSIVEPCAPFNDGPIGAKRIACNTGAATGAAYQRRAQFRLTMATYQGRATRPVPANVLDEIRDQMEASARHLINGEASEPIQRYARVTRVHMLSLLRTMGSSRWYRESHYIHATLTSQAPPDISDLESTMLFMFDPGNLRRSFCFFC